MALADGRRPSPPESVFAALVHEAGLPAPQPQYRVLLDDRFVGRVDFAGPKRRVLVEVDGFAFHGEQGAWLRDQRRQRGLTKAG